MTISAPSAATGPQDRLVARPPFAPPGTRRLSIPLRRDVISYLEWPAPRPGAPVAVLLHGLQSTALTMTRTAEGLRARGWRVLAPDLPGHGYSYALDGSDRERPGAVDLSRLAILRHRLSRRYRLRATAGVLAQLLRRLGIEHPVLVGHSWGASIASVAAEAGSVPSRLVLVDPPFVTVREAWAIGRKVMVDPTTSYEDARDTLLSRRTDWHPVDLAAKAEAVTRVSTRAMVAVVAGNAPFDPLPALTRHRRRHPEVPVVVISGQPGHGSFVTEEGLARLRALLGDERVAVMEGVGHSPHRSDHDAFMALLWRAVSAPLPA